MSWYDSDYRQRAAISIPSSAGAATIDADITIPSDWDDFWDVIDASGNELRVTGPDGYTLVTYDVDDGAGGAFNRTTRAGRIRIDGASTPAVAAECLLFWVYFDTSSTQGDGSSAVTITSALTGYIDRGQPSTWIAAAEPPRPGTTTPRHKFGKSVADQLYCFLDITGILEQRALGRRAGRAAYEEPRSATYEVQLSSSEVAQAGMIDADKMRWIEVRGRHGRRLFLRLLVKAGTSGETYTLVTSIPTCVPIQSGTHRTPAPRVGFRVRNVLE